MESFNLLRRNQCFNPRKRKAYDKYNFLPCQIKNRKAFCFGESRGSRRPVVCSILDSLPIAKFAKEFFCEPEKQG